jgi:hypothetical protein
MAVESRFDAATGIVSLIAEGEAGAEDLAKAMSNLAREKGLSPPFRVLLDRRAITQVFSTPEVQGAADRLTGFGPLLEGARLAIVVRREVAFGMARMLQAYTENLSVSLRGFYDEAEAIAWLKREAE